MKFNVALASILACILSACGGGGSGSTPAAAAPATTPAQPVASTPALASPPLTLKSINSMGTAFWADGSTANGGRGQPISGVECLKTEDYHIHSHLAIFKEGELLAIPSEIGLQGCAYELHTHNKSGVLHVETSAYRRFTLGQFFAVWGQPLDRNNIAGITGLPVAIYINDGAGLVEYKDAPADIELRDKREITIIVGKVPAVVPSFDWTGM